MEDGGVEGERVLLREEADTSVAGEVRNSAEQGGGLHWLTVDGPLGVQQDEALKLARKLFYGGFCFLPWLWFVNCFYFWPVLRHRQLDPLTRVYIVASGVGCLTFTTILLAWSLTFASGGERVFGTVWEHLAVYNLADKYAMAWAQ